jgi:ABC-2 type transport system permease protein
VWLRNVFGKTLWDQRRSLPAWMAATAAVAAMYAGFYPQVSGGAMGEMVANFPQVLKDAFHLDELSSAAGYLQSTTFGLLVPLLIISYGITAGTRAIAGDEEAGQLDVLLTHPISRTGLLMHRFAALVAGTMLVAGLVFLAMIAIRSSARLDTITVGNFAAQCLGVALLGAVFGALAIALGAAFGRRSLVLAMSAAFGILAYAANTFGPQLGAEWTRRLSPFRYFIGGEPLKHGFQWGDVGILAGSAAVLVAVGAVVFTRRDLTS